MRHVCKSLDAVPGSLQALILELVLTLQTSSGPLTTLLSSMPSPILLHDYFTPFPPSSTLQNLLLTSFSADELAFSYHGNREAGSSECPPSPITIVTHPPARSGPTYSAPLLFLWMHSPCLYLRTASSPVHQILEPLLQP